jgi:hypothetical protein
VRKDSGGLCVKAGSREDGLDEELKVVVVLDDGEGLHRLGYLIVFLRRPTGVASVITPGLATMLLWGLLNPTAVKETLPESG